MGVIQGLGFGGIMAKKMETTEGRCFYTYTMNPIKAEESPGILLSCGCIDTRVVVTG